MAKTPENSTDPYNEIMDDTGNVPKELKKVNGVDLVDPLKTDIAKREPEHKKVRHIVKSLLDRIVYK